MHSKKIEDQIQDAKALWFAAMVAGSTIEAEALEELEALLIITGGVHAEERLTAGISS